MNYIKIIVFGVCLFLGLQQIKAQEDNKLSNVEKYEQSLKLWEQQKKEHNNSYEFTMSSGAKAGYNGMTTIVVKEGKVIRRSFEEKAMEVTPSGTQKREPKKWLETGGAVGANKGGARAITMDEVYLHALQLVKPKEIKDKVIDGDTIKAPKVELRIYIETAENGLLNLVSSQLLNSTDKAPSIAYGIPSFRWLSQAELDDYALKASLQDEHSEAYVNSLKLWQEQKAAHNNSYEFSLVWGSFSGYSHTTTITVKNGEIIKRAYKEYVPKDMRREGVKPQKWVEKGDDIGTHKEGKQAMTLDNVYNYAKGLLTVIEKPTSTEVELEGEKIILTLPEINIYFSADNKGLISSAGSTPEGCMDDCFSGYTVRDIKWLD